MGSSIRCIRPLKEPEHPTTPESFDPHRGDGQPRVAVTVHIAKDTFELLRDVALAGQLANVAERSHEGLVDGQFRPTTVEAVIGMLIDGGRLWLEGQADTIRRPGKT